MIDQRHGLGIARAEQPGLLNPIRFEVRVKLDQMRQELSQDIFFGKLKVLMILGQVIADINNVITAEMFGDRKLVCSTSERKG